ncbi:uncharacterized protein LOC131148618 [Malania oleifera]|uniref:uncharacterized protein LOC131148618 n=1 Tax=Malania oleifera TaxID=397392 RepID=UPI0025ADB69A|nr:uncharacterized protein LOC131148618 [Malania oleifera]
MHRKGCNTSVSRNLSNPSERHFKIKVVGISPPSSLADSFSSSNHVNLASSRYPTRLRKLPSHLDSYIQAVNEELAALLLACGSWYIFFLLDVKNVFLNGDLKVEVYMSPPLGVPHHPGEFCRIRKALYGLKQTPKAWFEKFSKVLYDMILIGDEIDEIANLKSKLHHHFEMKDLGAMRYFLSIKVAYSPKVYLLSQSKYIAYVIQKARLTDTRAIETPLELNIHYTSFDGVLLADPTLYYTIVGSLAYISITRPDNAYAVHIDLKFVSFLLGWEGSSIDGRIPHDALTKQDPLIVLGGYTNGLGFLATYRVVRYHLNEWSKSETSSTLVTEASFSLQIYAYSLTVVVVVVVVVVSHWCWLSPSSFMFAAQCELYMLDVAL